MATAALIATGDPKIVDDLLRLAAAANAEAEVARSAEHVRAAWHRVPLVLVGADLADALAAGGLTRRAGVVLVTASDHSDGHRMPDGSRSAAGYRAADDYRTAGAADGYRAAVEVGAQDLAVLPDDEAWLVDAMAAAAEPHYGWATTICVAGGRGGAGASVLAAVLGLVGSRHQLRTLLVDGDPLGGGIDLVLGQEEAAGPRWPELAERRGRLSAEILRKSLPGVGDLTVLSWHRGDAEPVAGEAMHSVLEAAARGFDLVIVDLARHPGEAGRVALRTAHSTLLVVPAELRATAAADRVAATLRADTEDLRLVVRGPAPGGLSGEVIADTLGLPLAGFVMNDRRLPVALEQGDLVRVSRRGPLTDLCNRLITDFGLQPAALRGEAA